MKNKAFFKRMGEIFLILIILVSFFFLSSSYFRNSEADSQFSDFYALNNDVDVLFLGTSHVVNGIFPMDLWMKDGITSYNLATYESRMAMNYWKLRNALLYTTPKLVVIDCYSMDDVKANVRPSFIRQAFDTVPINREKISAMLDLYNNPSEFFQYISPFSAFHTVWDPSNDILIQDRPAGSMGNVCVFSLLNYDDKISLPDYATDVSNVGFDYLDKIISLCKERDIEVLLTYIPTLMSEFEANNAVYLSEFAKEHDVNYLDPVFLSDYINSSVDISKDRDIANTHLNLSGAHKISEFLSGYIKDNYDIPDHREDANYGEWHTKETEYINDVGKTIQDESSFLKPMLLLSDYDIDCVIRINNPEIYDNYVASILLGIPGFDISSISAADETIYLARLGRECSVISQDDISENEDFSSILNFNSAGSDITVGVLGNNTTYFGNLSLSESDTDIW